MDRRVQFLKNESYLLDFFLNITSRIATFTPVFCLARYAIATKKKKKRGPNLRLPLTQGKAKINGKLNAVCNIYLLWHWHEFYYIVHMCFYPVFFRVIESTEKFLSFYLRCHLFFFSHYIKYTVER